jgi:hypothetical protein
MSFTQDTDAHLSKQELTVTAPSAPPNGSTAGSQDHQPPSHSLFFASIPQTNNNAPAVATPIQHSDPLGELKLEESSAVMPICFAPRYKPKIFKKDVTNGVIPTGYGEVTIAITDDLFRFNVLVDFILERKIKKQAEFVPFEFKPDNDTRNLSEQQKAQYDRSLQSLFDLGENFSLEDFEYLTFDSNQLKTFKQLDKVNTMLEQCALLAQVNGEHWRNEKNINSALDLFEKNHVTAHVKTWKTLLEEASRNEQASRNFEAKLDLVDSIYFDERDNTYRDAVNKQIEKAINRLLRKIEGINTHTQLKEQYPNFYNFCFYMCYRYIQEENALLLCWQHYNYVIYSGRLSPSMGFLLEHYVYNQNSSTPVLVHHKIEAKRGSITLKQQGESSEEKLVTTTPRRVRISTTKPTRTSINLQSPKTEITAELVLKLSRLFHEVEVSSLSPEEARIMLSKIKEQVDNCVSPSARNNQVASMLTPTPH